jgi:hypothetical protein
MVGMIAEQCVLASVLLMPRMQRVQRAGASIPLAAHTDAAWASISRFKVATIGDWRQRLAW